MAGISQEMIDQMVGMIQTEAVKEKLKQRTQEALDLGVRHCLEALDMDFVWA